MNPYFLVAGILAILLGAIHSFLGEYLIFRKLQMKHKLVPTRSPKGLGERHLRILWGTWHLASIFGFGIGIALIQLAWIHAPLETTLLFQIISTIAIAMLISSLVILVATKGKHPEWIILLLIGTLLLMGL